MNPLPPPISQQGSGVNPLIHSAAQLYVEEASRVSDQNLVLAAAAVMSEQRLATIIELHATTMSQLRAQLDGLVSEYRSLEQEERRLVEHGLDPLQTIQADFERNRDLAYREVQARSTALVEETAVQIRAEEERANSSIAATKQNLVAQSTARIAKEQQLAAERQQAAAQAAAARATAAEQQRINAAWESARAADRARIAAEQNRQLGPNQVRIEIECVLQ